MAVFTRADAQAQGPIPPISSPPSQHIVFLIDADASEISADLVERFRQTLNAEIALTWEEVIAADQARTIDALILDHSAINQVDPGWLAHVYQRGGVIATLNVSVADMARLINDPCLANDSFASEGYSGAYFIIAYQQVLGNNHDDTDRVLQSQRTGCGSVIADGVVGSVVVARSRATNSFETDNDFNLFTQLLTAYLEDISRERQDFATGAHLRPGTYIE